MEDSMWAGYKVYFCFFADVEGLIEKFYFHSKGEAEVLPGAIFAGKRCIPKTKKKEIAEIENEILIQKEWML